MELRTLPKKSGCHDTSAGSSKTVWTDAAPTAAVLAPAPAAAADPAFAADALLAVGAAAPFVRLPFPRVTEGVTSTVGYRLAFALRTIARAAMYVSNDWTMFW